MPWPHVGHGKEGQSSPRFPPLHQYDMRLRSDGVSHRGHDQPMRGHTVSRDDSRTIEISVVGVATLWVGGFLLLLWRSSGGPTSAGVWAIYLTAIASVWTIIISQARSRRKMVEAVRRELALGRLSDERTAVGLQPVP